MREKFLNFIFILIVFLLGAGFMYVVDDVSFKEKDNSIQNVNNITENRNITITDNDISEAVADVYDSVVMIRNYQNNKYAGSGSGFVYKTDDKYGYILTNYHVVEGNTNLTVLYSNEKEVTAEYLSGDKYLDVAVVRVNKSSVLKVAKLGKTSELSLGDTVFAVGTPVGEEYYNTITRGIISGLNRKITVSVNSTDDWVMKALQVDVAINPGNSGGPLVNGKGEVIGINSMKLMRINQNTPVESIGFSIMIEDALAYTDLFESGKEIDRPLLGISLLNATDTRNLSRYGIVLDSTVTYGVVVLSVAENSGASKSELRKGDVIIQIGNEKIDNKAYLKYVLYSYEVGDTIDVEYVRGKEKKSTKVTLTKNDE